MVTILNPDEPYSREWGFAMDLLQQHQNPLEILDLLADGAPVHDWVRSEIKAWLEGKRPPLPKELTDENRRLVEAAKAFKNEPWLWHEQRGDRDGRIKRIAAECNVLPAHLESFIKCEGGRYRQSKERDDEWNEWERVYLTDPSRDR
jgi:hypothetical protein